MAKDFFPVILGDYSLCVDKFILRKTQYIIVLSYITGDVQTGDFIHINNTFTDFFLPLDREDSLFTVFGLPVKSSIILRLCRVRA